jgi:hypothetical protein
VEVDCRGLDAVNSFAALNQLKGRWYDLSWLFFPF